MGNTNNRTFSYNRGVRYKGNTYPSSDATIVDDNGQQRQGPIFIDANSQYYTMQNGAPVSVMPLHTLDEVTVTPKREQLLTAGFNNWLTQSNDATMVNNLPHREYNTHLKDNAINGAKSHAIWEQEHPNLAAWSYAAGAAPFAVAATPFVAPLGQGLINTAAGQAVRSGLTTLMANPIVDAANTGLGLGFAARGAYDVSQGKFTPETALELSGLYPMVKGSNRFFQKWLREPNKSASKIDDTLVGNSLSSVNGTAMPFSFKQDPLEMHKARATAKGYDPSKVKIYNLSDASKESTKFINDYAQKFNMTPAEASKELLDYLDNHGHGAAYFGKGVILHDGKTTNTSAILSHEFDHALHIPSDPLPDDVFYPRVKNIHGDYFTRYNNTEVASRGSQIHDYYGHTGNEPITAEELQYAKKHYVRDTGIDNMMHDFLWSIKDEHLGTVADWMTRNSTAIIPFGIVGNSVYQTNE